MKKSTKITLGTRIYLTIGGLAAMAATVYAVVPTPLFFDNQPQGTGLAVSTDHLYATGWCNQTLFGADCMGNVSALGVIPGGDNPCIEKYMEIAPRQSVAAGFTVKDVFITEGQNIYKFTYPAGPITLFAQVGCPFSNHSSITFDKVGTFGNKMIVTCENGPVWTIDGSGNVTFLGSFTTISPPVATHPEGPAVAPLSFGPGLPVDLAGKLLVADETQQAVHAMDNLGNVTYNVFSWPAGFGLGSENVSFVPQIPCSFGCQAQGPGKFFQMIESLNGLIYYSPTDFSGFVGDAIVTTESDGPPTQGTIRIHFNPVTHLYETTVFDSTFATTTNEGARFVECDVATPTPTPTATATFTPTPTATFTPTATATFTPTPTATFTPTPTATSTPTPTPTSTSTPSGVCPLTQGYWKNHPNAWPVNSLMLGSQTYTKAELLNILNTPVGGDASLNLAHQLIAAKLNIAAGSDPTPISSTFTHADSLLSMFSGKLPYHVASSSSIGQMMVSDANTLDNYNNGNLTPSCSGQRGAPAQPPRPARPPR